MSFTPMRAIFPNRNMSFVIAANGRRVQTEDRWLETFEVRMHERDLPEFVHEDDFEEWKDEIEDGIDRVIRIARANLGPANADQMGVRITAIAADGSEKNIYINFMLWHVLTASVITNRLEKTLTSGDHFLGLNLNFTFSVYRPGNRSRNMQKKTFWNGNFEWFTKHKRSIVEIHPSNDPFRDTDNCFFQFLVLGLCGLMRSSNPIFNRIHDLLGMDENSYKLCTVSGSKFTYRQQKAIDIQYFLNQQLGVLTQDNEGIKKVEDLLDIRIVLFKLSRQFHIDYPNPNVLPYTDTKPTIFGLISGEGELWNHVDYISKPSALSNVSGAHRLCYYCFTTYKKLRSCDNPECNDSNSPRCFRCHQCDGICWTCCSTECGKIQPNQLDERTQPYSGTLRCTSCRSVYYSPLCREQHEKVCKDQWRKICTLCNRSDHPGLKCNETRCMMCGEKIVMQERANHQCYIRNCKLKKPMNKYWSYDVETARGIYDEHVLYLITAWPIYDIPDSVMIPLFPFPHRIFNDDKNRPVFIFWGLGDPAEGTGVYQFFEFITHPALSGSEFFAHNGGKYDTIFIENYMSKYKMLAPSKISRGLKILNLYYPTLDITFKDSINFIPSALRNMSTDFGIEELRKGHFPHKLITVEYLKEAERTNFIVPRPSRDMFHADFGTGQTGIRDRAEFEAFLDQFYSTSDPWNLKQDAIDYCISDTILLGKTLHEYREKTIYLTDGIERVCEKFQTFDPLQYVTGPSGIMKFYLSQLLPEKTISIIDRYESLVKIMTEKWLLWEEYKRGIQITRVLDIDNMIVAGESEDFIFRFLPCYNHGCPICMAPVARNARVGWSFGKLLEMTRDAETKLSILTRKKVIDMWSHTWTNMIVSEEYQEWYTRNEQKIIDELPLDPRDAYKGGITELYKIFYPGKIQMVDYVSQYPTSLLGESICPFTQDKIYWPMPTGPHTSIWKPKKYSFENQLGVIKCRVLPPQDLYAPFLGYKLKSLVDPGVNEVIYGLCKECMDIRNQKECFHINEFERSFVGTWTLTEIDYALSLGYKILNITEVWVYQDKDHNLFKNFIVPFMITKITSKKSGLVVNEEFTTKGLELAAYVKESTGVQLVPSQFQNSPSLRTIAKLIMNSFYGKWGQRSIWSESAVYDESDEKDMKRCWKLLSSHDVSISFGEVIQIGDRTLISMMYEKDPATTKGDKQKNDHIAAYVTAYGRIMIHRAIHNIGDKALYCDTDSVFHIQTTDKLYETGFRIGDLELELDDAHYWVANGRKSYAYRKPDGSHVTKQKGIALKQSLAHLFTPEKMLRMILKSAKAFEEFSDQSEDTIVPLLKQWRKEAPAIEAPQFQFKTVKENSIVSRKHTIEQMKKTSFLLWSLKRVPQWNDFNENEMIDTLPYGFSLSQDKMQLDTDNPGAQVQAHDLSLTINRS